MKGALLTNGIIILNMCGDVIYIIDQRLKAQNICQDKGLIVLNDLVTQIYSQSFLKHVFKVNKLFTNEFVYKLIDQIVHCSIMKLNHDSLSKLYDLVLMTLKSYIMKSSSPFEIYQCTLNHFDGVMQLGINDSARQALQSCQKIFIEQYSALSSLDYIMIRSEILRFTQNKFIRVQMFLNDKSQNQDGTFQIKPDGQAGIFVDQPGQIQIVTTNENYQVILATQQGFIKNNSSNQFKGNIKIGRNIFQLQQQVKNDNQNNQQSIQQEQLIQTQEIHHLASLIQQQPISREENINLFYKPELIAYENNKEEIKMDDAQRQSQKMKQSILSMFEETEQIQINQNEEDDLLALMDQAANL